MAGLNLPEIYYLVFALLTGLLIGSFLNVVIHRVPLDRSIVFPGSACPSCGARIRAFDNIPLISFIMLRGRCRDCNARISIRYPMVELLTGLVFVLIVWETGATWVALLEMTFAASMIALVFIDARHQLLPNVITYPTFLFTLVASTVRAGWGSPIIYAFDFSLIFTSAEADFPVTRAAITGGVLLAIAVPGFLLIDKLDLILFNKYFEWEEMNETASTDNIAEDHDEADRRYDRVIGVTMMFGLLCGIAWTVATLLLAGEQTAAFENGWDGLIRASTAAFVAGLITWWIRAVYFYVRGFEGMGLGDVKMMAAIGAFLGWQGAFSTLLLGSIAGAVIGSVMAIRNRSGIRTALPLGLFLGAAAIFVLIWMNQSR